MSLVLSNSVVEVPAPATIDPGGPAVVCVLRVHTLAITPVRAISAILTIVSVATIPTVGWVVDP